MKIKMDFVTNSSSTSFIYISSADLTMDAFLSAIGVSKNSPILSLFENMYYVLKNSIELGDRIFGEAQLENNSRHFDFTPEVIERAKSALKEGNDIIIGLLSSDEAIEESFLCMEVFEIESNEFYINAYSNIW